MERLATKLLSWSEQWVCALGLWKKECMGGTVLETIDYNQLDVDYVGEKSTII